MTGASAWQLTLIGYPGTIFVGKILVPFLRAEIVVGKFWKKFDIYIFNVQHRSQIGMYNYLNCSMKVVYYIFTCTPGVVRFHSWTNPRTQVFWENQFFHLKKLWGVIFLKLFDRSNGLGVRNFQNSHFWAKSSLALQNEKTDFLKKSES